MRTLLATAAAVLLIAAAPASRLVVLQRCGAGSVTNSCIKAGPLVADFDGDGVADKIELIVESGPLGHFAGENPDVTVVSTLWGNAPLIDARRGAILIAKLSKGNKEFILADYSGYFDTPIWHGKDLPISVAKRGSKAFNEFQSQEKHIQHDILVLGTEAGIDTALYWDGKTFALFAPAEEP